VCWAANPDGGGVIVPAAQTAGSVTHAPVPSHSLMPLLVQQRRLRQAARSCMRRASAPGADRVTWAGYRQGLDERLARLSQRLAEGTWVPGPLRIVEVSTFTGKRIEVVIPTVEDRIVHRALRACLDLVLESGVLAEFVSGYRPRRNRVTAVAQAARHVAAGCRWVADVDVADASGGASVDDAVGWVAACVHDGTFLQRVRTALAGLPQPVAPGSGLSPTLLNLRLRPVDVALADLMVVRFCDNYCAFAASSPEASKAFARIEGALAGVGLMPSLSKSRVRHGVNPEDLFLIGG
jgi:hypothetical protein